MWEGGGFLGPLPANADDDAMVGAVLFNGNRHYALPQSAKFIAISGL